MKFKISAVRVLFSLLVVIVFGACNEYDEIGTTILPESDNLNLVTMDTATILASTVREDSLRTNGFTAFPVSYNIVGSLNEQSFGRTLASAYMQLNLSKFNFSYGATSTADSLILSLALTSYYGDTTSPVHFKVYRMDELINEDSAYYSSTTLPAATLIGDAIITVHPKDSAMVGGVKKFPQIRIPLDASLAAELMIKSGGPDYVDNTAFNNYFKGVYITAESVSDPGCLFQFDYKNAESKMVLHYKFSVDSDSLAFSYVFDELARFNHFDHDYYAGTKVFQALNDVNAGIDYIFIQSMAGVKSKIQLPYLRNYFIDNPSMVINSAILVFKAEPNNLYAPNPNTSLAYVDATGKSLSFEPDNREGANAADGTYLSTPGEYRFNITRYVSQVMTGQLVDYGIYLRTSSAIVNPNHTIIYGSNNPSGKIKLELTYTKF